MYFQKRDMEIKRNFEKLVVTKRRLVFRQTSVIEHAVCIECGETMLPIAQAAVVLGIRQSRIFRITETGAAHFSEVDSGTLMICINSLSGLLEADGKE